MKKRVACFTIAIFLVVAGAAGASAQSGAAAQPQQQPTQQSQTAPQPLSRAQFIADMDAEFRNMDADKNGILTKAEIEQYERATLAARQQARRRALFARLDTNRDGQLSMEEFSRLQLPTPPSRAGAMIGRFDLNRDQAISMIEYRTVTQQNFDRMDTDKDGVVSPAEMQAAGLGQAEREAGTRP